MREIKKSCEEKKNEDITDILVDRIVEQLLSRININKFIRRVDNVLYERLLSINREMDKIEHKIMEMSYQLDKSSRIIKDAIVELEENIRKLDNETMVSRIENLLENTINRINSVSDKLEGLIRQLEEVNKTVDSRINGYYGSILQQIQDVRRYCLDVRREARRCFQLKEDRRGVNSGSGGGEEA